MCKLWFTKWKVGFFVSKLTYQMIPTYVSFFATVGKKSFKKWQFFHHFYSCSMYIPEDSIIKMYIFNKLFEAQAL